MGDAMARGLQRTGLALVAVRQRDRHAADYEGREACCINLGPCHTGCAQGAKSSADITYWPMAIGARASSCARAAGCARSWSTRTTWPPASIYYDADGVEHFQRGRGGDPGVQRRGHAAPAAELRVGALSGRAGQPLGPGRQEPDAASVGPIVPATVRRAAGGAPRPQGNCILSKEFYETDRARGFVRGYTIQFTRGPGPVTTARISGSPAARIPWGAGSSSRRTGTCARPHGEHRRRCEDLPEEHNTVTLDPRSPTRTASRRRRSRTG
jgi:hypothetical protein